MIKHLALEDLRQPAGINQNLGNSND